MAKSKKSPAFNFYPESFLGGTRKMSDKEVGIYIRALCHQYCEGYIENDEYKTFPKRVQEKFVKSESGWINEKLCEVIEKKKAYTEGRLKNLQAKPLEERLKEAGVIGK